MKVESQLRTFPGKSDPWSFTPGSKRSAKWVLPEEFVHEVGEKWKPIKGFEKYGFEVSNMGRVRRFKNGRYHLLHPNPNENGYYKVNLYTSRWKCNTKKIARLVAAAFVARKHPSHGCVNHKDGNKANNRADNLEWVTYEGNSKHARETGLCDAPRKLTESERVEILMRLDKGEACGSIARALDLRGATVFAVRDRGIGGLRIPPEDVIFDI